MSTILTSNIESNSFLGLVTNAQSKNSKLAQSKKMAKRFGRKAFVKVESKEVLMNLAIATVIIVMGLAVGSVSQQKMTFAKYSTPITKAAV